jgi:8-oxo-dGTP diphosphatase
MDIRVAAYAVIVDGTRVLLAHWNEHGRSGWTLPGGGLESGEDPTDAALREVVEETGYTAELDELIGVDSRVIPEDQRHTGSGPLQTLRIVYRAHLVGGALRNEADGSTDEARWFELDEIPGLRTVSLVDVGLRFAGLAD